MAGLKEGYAARGEICANRSTQYELKRTSPRDADTAKTPFLVVCSVPAVCEAPYRFAIGASSLYCGNKNRSTRKE